MTLTVAPISALANFAGATSGVSLEGAQRMAAQAARFVTEPQTSALREVPQAARVLRVVSSPTSTAADLAVALRELSGNPLIRGLVTAQPEIAAQLGQQVSALQGLVEAGRPPQRSLDIAEVEAIRTSLLATRRELEVAETRSYAANYPGIRQYRKAIHGRIKDIDRIREAFEAGNPLSPRLEDRWDRLRMSYLGERENGFRSKFQQHLDVLREASTRHGGRSGDPLLTEMLARQDEYLGKLREIAEAERGTPSEIEMTLLAQGKEVLEQSYHEAVEAYYFLKGYMPTTWRGSFREMTRNFHWREPATWVPPLLLGGLTTFIASAGVEPTSFDGAIYPAVNRRWEGKNLETLVIEPFYKPRRTGLSRRALGAALLDTLRLQLALINTAGIDPTGGNFEGFIPSWMRTILARTGTTVRVEGLKNLKGLHGENLIVTPTHRGFVEYPILMGIEDEFGHPFRIVAKDSFRTNPAIRALVGLAMQTYNFIFIDRSAGSDAVRTMKSAGQKAREGRYSVVTYPSASRSPTLVFNGHRIEGPHYQAKHGVGYMAQEAGDPAIVPVAIVNSGVLTPKSIGEQARGVPLGQTVTVKIDTPFRPSSLRTEGMNEDQLSLAIAARLDERYRELTGLPTGPLYRDRAPKTIFQANDPTAFEKAMRERIKQSRRYRHSAVVFPPDWQPERGEIERMARKAGLPKGARLTVFQATRNPDGTYRFPSYDIVG